MEQNVKLLHRRDLSCSIFVDSDTEKPHIFKLSDALSRCKCLGHDLAVCQSNFGFPLVEAYIDNGTLNKIPKEMFKRIEDRPIYMATMGVLTFVSFYNGGEKNG